MDRRYLLGRAVDEDRARTRRDEFLQRHAAAFLASDSPFAPFRFAKETAITERDGETLSNAQLLFDAD